MQQGMMNADQMMMGWGGMLFGLLMMIGVIVVIVVAVILIVRMISPGAASNRPAEDRSLAILRERFAAGEIEETEFENRKRRLEA